jgi:hypothetical protein
MKTKKYLQLFIAGIFYVIKPLAAVAANVLQ